MTHLTTRRIRRAALAALPAGLALSLGACSLDVLTPTVIQPADAQAASALPTRLAGALGDFSVAYGGYNNSNNGDGLALISGLFSDEFIATDQFDTHNQLDRRIVSPVNATNGGVLRNIMRSLVSAQGTADAYVTAKVSADSSVGRAQALNLVGFDFTFVAENYCSGVPFSRIAPDGNFLYGSPISTTQMLDSAIAKFTTAQTVAQGAAGGGDADFADTARVVAQIGRGRALLDQGKYAEAAAAVATVDRGFVYATEQSSADPRVTNGIFSLTYLSSRYTTANSEGTNGLNFVSANDPRLVTEPRGLSSFDNGTRLFAPKKYNDYAAPIVIASGVEATLIRAEAALQANNYAGANGTLQLLNAVRADSGLAPLSAANTRAEQVSQLFRERAFWLFGTAHRLGDLRRLAGQYALPVESVFPTGTYFKTGSYGTQVSLRVPEQEGTNPNYTAASCDPTKI